MNEAKSSNAGLITMAVIHFIIGGGAVMAIINSFIFDTVRIDYILGYIAIGAAMIATGIGFIKQDYKLGYLWGNAFAIITLLVIFSYGIGTGFKKFGQQTPGLVYFGFLLLMLNVFLKGKFKR